MLLFTPELCRGEPYETLESVLEWVDIVQIRSKPARAANGSHAPGAARDTYDGCARVLDILAAHPSLHRLVIVNDRVDVAREAGADGVSVISALSLAPDPTAAARELRAIVDAALAQHAPTPPAVGAAGHEMGNA